MRTLVMSVAVILGIVGCAAGPHAPSYGNFVPNTDEGHCKRIAEDVVRQLAVLYPPARTRFNLQQPTPDPFGAALVANMRDRGYALLESSVTAPSPAMAESGNVRPRAAGDPDNLTVSYVLDRPVSFDLYRVTLMVGEKSLSRLYLTKDGVVAPAGSWVHKE